MIISLCVKGRGEEQIRVPAGWADDVAWVNSSESVKPRSVAASVRRAIARQEDRGAAAEVVGLDLEALIPHNDPLGYWRHAWTTQRRTLEDVLARARAAAGARAIAPYPLASINQWDAVSTDEPHTTRRRHWQEAMRTHVAAMVASAGGGCVEHYFDTGTNEAHDAAVVSATWTMGTPAFGTRPRTAIVMPEIAWGESAGAFVDHARFDALLSLLRDAGYVRTLVFGGVGGPGEKSVDAWNEWLVGAGGK